MAYIYSQIYRTNIRVHKESTPKFSITWLCSPLRIESRSNHLWKYQIHQTSVSVSKRRKLAVAHWQRKTSPLMTDTKKYTFKFRITSLKEKPLIMKKTHLRADTRYYSFFFFFFLIWRTSMNLKKENVL